MQEALDFVLARPALAQRAAKSAALFADQPNASLLADFASKAARAAAESELRQTQEVLAAWAPFQRALDRLPAAGASAEAAGASLAVLASLGHEVESLAGELLRARGEESAVREQLAQIEGLRAEVDTAREESLLLEPSASALSAEYIAAYQGLRAKLARRLALSPAEPRNVEALALRRIEEGCVAELRARPPGFAAAPGLWTAVQLCPLSARRRMVEETLLRLNRTLRAEYLTGADCPRPDELCRALCYCLSFLFFLHAHASVEEALGLGPAVDLLCAELAPALTAAVTRASQARRFTRQQCATLDALLALSDKVALRGGVAQFGRVVGECVVQLRASVTANALLLGRRCLQRIVWAPAGSDAPPEVLALQGALGHSRLAADRAFLEDGLPLAAEISEQLRLRGALLPAIDLRRHFLAQLVLAPCASPPAHK